MKQGETRVVSPEFFAEALAQGAVPANGDYAPAPAPEPVAAVEQVEETEFATPSLDNAEVLGEEDRYPEGVSGSVPTPGVIDEFAIQEALRRIALRANPRDFGPNGVPKARALTAELGGVTVVSEVREAAWDVVSQELAR